MKNLKALLILCLCLFACKHSESGKSNPIQQKEEKESDFVKISATTIVGKNPSYNLSSGEHYWKGVFLEGREVTLSEYEIAKTEVSYKLWKEVLDFARTKDYVFANEGLKGARNDGSGDEAEPVTTVSWWDAVIWCNAYTEMKNGNDAECVYRKTETDNSVLRNATNKVASSIVFFDQTKKGFRLPTEAEWELAARFQTSNKNAEQHGSLYLTRLDSVSGAKKPIAFKGVEKGSYTYEELRDESSTFAVYGQWFDGKDVVDQEPKVQCTQVVKSKKANELGLFDMSGNITEWCFDYFGRIGEGKEKDPMGAGLLAGGTRSTRGGSWADEAVDCSVGVRYGAPAITAESDLGFRLAKYK